MAERTRRAFLTVAATLSVPLAGCTEDDDNGEEATPTPTPPPDATPSPTPEETSTPDEDTPTPDPEPGEPGTLTSLQEVDMADWDAGATTFSGDASVVTDPVGLSHVATAITYSFEGDGNFINWLIDDEGDQVDLLINEIGSIEGARAFSLPNAGEYRMDIDADGPWSLTIGQPLVPETVFRVPPADASGSGNDALALLLLDGDTTISGQHEGDSNFIVHLIDEDASGFLDEELVFNEIGEFDGQTHSGFEGWAFVNVEADGPWELTFE